VLHAHPVVKLLFTCVVIILIAKMDQNEKIPDPKEIEKEISEFLAKKFKDNVKIVSPVVLSQELALDSAEKKPEKKKKINFDLLPEDLIAYLDQFIVKQDQPKAILATKICTHFNRIKHAESSGENNKGIVGQIKNNILMIGPTGVGKTEIARRLANLAQSPFLKVEASKFTEIGYVGRDVESMIRDLVELAVNMVKKEERREVEQKAHEMAEEKLLDLLL